MEHKFHLHLLLHLLLWLASTSSSFSIHSPVTKLALQDDGCDKPPAAPGTAAGNVNMLSSDRVSPRSDQDVEENKADQKLSKENENQYYCPMETSESIASKQFKGVLASAIRQRLRELLEKARAATEAAHAIELLMLLGESNLGSDQMNEKVHEAVQLLKTSA
ncbi:hypothetical protein HYC85_022542 [Camellia sinensis]|uniref:Uncharacterized protein n=1 Tax=Camellia sinensis TaxID=4442 RepID=A0A7J7GMC0_CAMSI|nr:hypothetical protein HYC85_022542 [Camellia sinensis]